MKCYHPGFVPARGSGALSEHPRSPSLRLRRPEPLVCAHPSSALRVPLKREERKVRMGKVARKEFQRSRYNLEQREADKTPARGLKGRKQQLY